MGNTKLTFCEDKALPIPDWMVSVCKVYENPKYYKLDFYIILKETMKIIDTYTLLGYLFKDMSTTFTGLENLQFHLLKDWRSGWFQMDL